LYKIINSFVQDVIIVIPKKISLIRDGIKYYPDLLKQTSGERYLLFVADKQNLVADN